MEIRMRTYRLELEYTFTISRESQDFQDSLIVALSHMGKTGYGETTSNPYYRHTIDSLKAEIESVSDDIRKHQFTVPEEFHAFLKSKGLSAFALCALDLAAHDLYGKLRNKHLYELWNTPVINYPVTDYTLGLDTPEIMIKKMKEHPWPLYKIKLGTDHDIELITRLREHTNVPFRVDVNCGWTADEAIEKSAALKQLGVEFIEQPLRADDWDGYKKLMNSSALPIIADESCVLEEDVEKCKGHFHGINIKLVKCGGLTPALRMIKKARELNLKVMAGCMTESTVGISALAQLLPQLDHVDMDGAMLLKHDIAYGVRIEKDATVIFPEEKGSGIRMMDEF